MTAYIYTKDNKRVITINNVVCVLKVKDKFIIQAVDVEPIIYSYEKDKFKVTLFTE